MGTAAGDEGSTTGDVTTGVTWSDIYESPQVNRSLRHLPRLCREAVRLVWAAGPRELLVVLAIKVVNGLGLALVLLLGKQVLDGVIAAGRSGAGASTVLPTLLLLTIVMAGLGFLSAIGREHREILAELASRHAQSQIIDVACAVELEAYETPAFHNRLVRAAGGGQFRPWQVVEGLTGLAGAVIGIAGITLALLTLQPWLVPLVLAAAVPLLIAVAKGGELMFGFRHRMTEAERRRNYLYMLLSGKDAAKELRAFGLSGFLRERFDRLYDEHMDELRKVARRRLRVSLLGNLATTVVLTGIVAALLVLALSGRIGLADAGTAAGAVFVLGERLMNAVFSAGMLYESSLFIEDFTSFVAMAPEVEARRSRSPAPAGFRRLRVEDVSFTYPSATTPAVTGVSIEIGAGEIVALVGENGSGKTTLAKLLCRLYLPHAGRVLWDELDTATADPDGLRRSVAVIFQDFLHYSLPAAENVGMGRHQRIGDIAAIRGAAVHAGADEFLAKLPKGYETVLGPEFDGGKELSVGQWQRVALARAFFRDAPFIILDEPTAALDARAEHELFESIRTLCRGRSVLLISHRFSSVRSADRIYVLDGGRVIESGSHDELMDLGGRYAELFTLQASAYLAPESS
ncbi:MAG TPA: ABC transporter ATP-binding protein [Actinomycetota bacterium]|jgi:ATP-binding cassette subfamily B protein|nr:ABC transporter ATP-binding protein [Actinomycetota bacterium]